MNPSTIIKKDKDRILEHYNNGNFEEIILILKSYGLLVCSSCEEISNKDISIWMDYHTKIGSFGG